MKFEIVDDLHVEPIEGGHLVLPPGKTDVLHLTGPDAEAFELAEHGTDVVPTHLETAMAGLVELGIVQTTVWSRRRVIQMGGAAAAAAVAVTALPSVAAAASGGSGGGSPTTGNVSVTLNTWDGLKDPQDRATSPQNLGPMNVYMYATADRTTAPVATTSATYVAGQTFIAYSFTNVAPGNYYVDIEEPFEQAGWTGMTISGNFIQVDWNLTHYVAEKGQAIPSWYQPVPADYQPVTVTAGNTTTLDLNIQVRPVVNGVYQAGN